MGSQADDFAAIAQRKAAALHAAMNQTAMNAAYKHSYGWIDPRGIYRWVINERDALDILIEEALDIYISLEGTNSGNV